MACTTAGRHIAGRHGGEKRAWQEYLGSHDRNKLLFGNNCPMIAPLNALDDLAEFAPAEATHALSLAGNACRVHGLNQMRRGGGFTGCSLKAPTE